MKTITISKTYTLKWSIKNHDDYGISKCGKVFNLKRNKLLKRVRNGGSIGYWLNGCFYTLEKLRKLLTKIEHYKLPF